MAQMNATKLNRKIVQRVKWNAMQTQAQSMQISREN